jgi:NADPH:quinone reductase-like Zn-dependent oxidoreductase
MPQPGVGEVRIRVHRAGVNFADVLARQGIYPDAPKMPFIPGYEVSGVVDLLGPGVDGIRAGERVAAFTRFGGYAEHAVAKIPVVVPLPPDIGFSVGAAVPVNFVTAYHCLFHTGALFPGDRVLVHAAAGGVGIAAVQMAKGAGAVVFGTAGSPEKVAFLKVFGVDHPIDYEAEDFVEAVRKATGGEGVDVILDSIGGQMLGRDLRVLRPGGRVVSLGLAAAVGKSRAVLLRELMSAPRLQPIKLLETSRGFFGVNILRIFDHRPALGSVLLRSVFDLVAAGKARPVIAGEIPIERASEAHRMLQERSTVGKVLLAVRDQ